MRRGSRILLVIQLLEGKREWHPAPIICNPICFGLSLPHAHLVFEVRNRAKFQTTGTTHVVIISRRYFIAALGTVAAASTLF